MREANVNGEKIFDNCIGPDNPERCWLKLTLSSVGDGSGAKRPVALAQDLGLVPSTQVAIYNNL